MRKIKLTQGKFALVDDIDYAWLNQWKWCMLNPRSPRPYVTRNSKAIKGKRHNILMHVVIMGCKGIDHRDGNVLNNQRNNLRKSTRQQNMGNRKPNKDTTSKYKGIFWRPDQNKWQAQIRFNKKAIHLGYFKSERTAAKAYDEAALKYFGEFARLNFPKTARQASRS